MKDEVIEQIKALGAENWVKNNPNAKNRIKQKMKKYATSYYEGVALITDLDFEYLIDALKFYDKNDEYLITPGWGYKIENGYKHIYGKVGTLEYFYNYNELKNKLKNEHNLIITPKLDGINFVAYYENGKFIRCLTRGNGYEGKDISWAFKNFSIPENLKDKSFAINGEVFYLGAKGVGRDITASYLNKKNINIGGCSNLNQAHLIKNIKFAPFGMFNIKNDYKTEIDTLNNISDFKLPFDIFDGLPTQKTLKNIFDNYLDKYDVDGLVITNFNKTIQVAYKFKNV